MNLALHHDFSDPRVEEFLRLGNRACNILGNCERGNRNTCVAQQLSSLILVDFHRARKISGARGRRCCANARSASTPLQGFSSSRRVHLLAMRHAVYIASRSGQVPERPKGTVC